MRPWCSSAGRDLCHAAPPARTDPRTPQAGKIPQAPAAMRKTPVEWGTMPPPMRADVAAPGRGPDMSASSRGAERNPLSMGPERNPPPAPAGAQMGPDGNLGTDCCATAVNDSELSNPEEEEEAATEDSSGSRRRTEVESGVETLVLSAAPDMARNMVASRACPLPPAPAPLGPLNQSRRHSRTPRTLAIWWRAGLGSGLVGARPRIPPSQRAAPSRARARGTRLVWGCRIRGGRHATREGAVRGGRC
jgi:hypothetical protein